MTIKITNSGSPIIFVDDEENDLEIYQRALRKSSIENPCLTFTCGNQFINFMTATMQGLEPPPAAIFLDINMSPRNGFQLLEVLGSIPGTEAIPIVMLTSSNHQRDFDRAKGLGCDDYLLKPDTAVAFTRILNKMVNDKK